MNDYRFPRTSGEAFRDAGYASAIERRRASRAPLVVAALLIAAVVIVSYLI